MIITVLSAAALIAPMQSAAATTAAQAPGTATVVRASQEPKIDGRDDDRVWQRAPRAGGFIQFAPRVDGKPTLATEFRAAYDQRNLYVFVRMYDPHPDSIMHALSRRDVRGPSDQIKLLIDPFNDRRSGYEFAVNPDGVKRDYSMSNDRNEDGSWDGVWDVATTVDSLGWTAEYRIPLSQLRYLPGARAFGFGIWRDIERYAERDAWPRYSPVVNGLSSQLGQLVGFEDLPGGRRVEALPYVVAKNVERTPMGGNHTRGQDLAMGGDLKVGLTPSVTLDATANPDFGQVEADPAQLNLTAFETFFDERRPFFVEGARAYQFQLNCYGDCNSNEGLFYSRRIGRAPSLAGIYRAGVAPTVTPIVAAGKLTGRTEGGLGFGVLGAVTERVHVAGDKTVEPGANYMVLRAQQELDQGNTSFSVMATGVNRALDPLTEPYLHKAAYAGGANVRTRFHNGDYELNARMAASRVEGSPAVLLRTQTNSVHYFQQPDGRLAVDSNATSLAGHEEELKFGKYGGGITRFETSVARQSAGFDVNDLGYLRRADRLNWSAWGALTWTTKRWIYNSAQLNLNHWVAWNTSGAKFDQGANVNAHMGLGERAGFLNRWDVHAGASLVNLGTVWCDRCTRGGPLVRQSRGFEPWVGFNSDNRKPVSFGSWFNFGWGDAGRSASSSISPYITYRASTRLAATLSAGFAHANDDQQWLGNFADSAAGRTHYAFAHLTQTTTGLSLRVNYTATPDLSLEFYGQPFVSTGTYTNVRDVSATPGAGAYAARFTPYTPPATIPMAFTYSQLRTNAVVRWEYRPGSTLFVVWQHGRQGFENENYGRAWTSDYSDLLSLHPDNTFLVKLAYWINR